jgi:hypothetical protein
MLLYDVLYLAHTQALSIPLAQAGDVLGNLWAVCCAPELGRRSHATAAVAAGHAASANGSANGNGNVLANASANPKIPGMTLFGKPCQVPLLRSWILLTWRGDPLDTYTWPGIPLYA